MEKNLDIEENIVKIRFQGGVFFIKLLWMMP